MMAAMSITQARADFSNMKNVKNIAAIIGMEDIELLENLSVAEDRVLAEMADEAMKEPGDNISLEEMKKLFARC